MKKIVIIGGGIAGLAAGIFAQKNGFESVILEKHHTLGGQCTGWDRQGYHIDGCIHWLVGTKEGTPINQLWNEVGALNGVEFYHPETFLSYEYGDVTVHLYRDLERLKSSWLDISPEDKEAIEEFYGIIKRLQSFEVPCGKPIDLMNLLEKLKFFYSMKDAGLVLQRYGKISLKKYAQRFKHPAIREMLEYFVAKGFTESSIFLFFGLASFTKGQASIPVGGSKALAMRMVQKYLELGGKIESRREVVDLEVQNGRITKAIAEDYNTYEADYFIAACDAKVFYDTLLKGQYPDEQFEMRFDNPQDYPLASNMYVSLGYEGEVGDLPRTLNIPSSSFEINGEKIERLAINHYNYEPDFAPKGHTIFTCAINQYHKDYDAWKELSKYPQKYKNEKQRIGNEVRKSMEIRFPHMIGKLRVLDVVSPVTYERYCNAHRGAFMAFMPTTTGKEMIHNGRVKGIYNLHLSGQWIQPPGGLPAALITGKDSIMRICKDEKRDFHR